MLSSTATKRDARSYLSRFDPRKPSTQRLKDSRVPHKSVKDQENGLGVNLGNLYLPARAIDESPVFTQAPPPRLFIDTLTETLHVALVKIRAPQIVDDVTLQSVGHTLSQLARLGLSCVVVVDSEGRQEDQVLDVKRDGDYRIAVEQADRIVAAIEHHRGQGARRLDSVIGVSAGNERLPSSIKVRGRVQVTHRSLLLAPLGRGVIPVIAPIGYTLDTQTTVPVTADEVVLALTREFAGLQVTALQEEDPHKVAESVKTLQKQISLDRIILLDPEGGIPSTDGTNRSHVFINLEQEYQGIENELLKTAKDSSGKSNHHLVVDVHVRNLRLLQNTLALLPPSSSALLTTPQDAANSGRPLKKSSRSLGVGTRRQRNPLIHNLLTDKPVLSSSLPSSRSRQSLIQEGNLFSRASPMTFVKRGMPVSIIPDPSLQPWTQSSPAPFLQLSDPRIDLPRLVNLIEDSFNRKLDISDYFSRIASRIAGVIVAGEYEGGALFTWETPPGVPDDGSQESRERMVPYLDKFAVLKRSQGSGGVADIVFKAMVRDCFPNGVCWRSRRDNPVNKWYFERAKGTWKMPDTNWTMFWTTEGVETSRQTFLDYEGVCKAVIPSWADNKAVVD